MSPTVDRLRCSQYSMMTYFFQFPPAEQQLHSFPSSAEQSWPVGLAALVRLDGGGGQRSRFEAACARLRQ